MVCDPPVGSWIYLGLDLAWSARNPSGLAVLRGGLHGATLVEPPRLITALDDLVAYMLAQIGDGPAILAVDAPLCVPNLTGQRPAEAALARTFRAYEAAAHPANRRLLNRDGTGVRGERLLERLAPYGFLPVTCPGPTASGRLVTEVYPHPAMIALFGLNKTLKYKSRPGRDHNQRVEAWHTYQQHLRLLTNTDPSLNGHLVLLEPDVATLRGHRLKAYEDQIDALFCAYIGLYAHRWGEARCQVFGDLATGWIMTPRI
ncbi:MAG: DUF429 domain-containing protein [Chloroflexia bacterium]|nr:DUF429 domain-containing protein [Chloroflexia bacterium]